MMKSQELRKELQEGSTPDLKNRRAVIVASLAGIASMAAVTLLRMEISKRKTTND